MSCFSENAAVLRYRVAPDGELGLRRPQAGAIHAVAAHFSLRSDPALVCMPTGSGKTLVLLMCPYVLEAQRVLVVTPSTIVRGQIAEAAGEDSELRTKGVLPDDIAHPAVHQVKRRIVSLDDWESLRAYDLVVATPHTLSPIYEGVPQPPADLFDLVLVDEAHHEAARGWREVLDALPNAKRVLFSATPFRRDRKEIRGRFVFHYSLGAAFNDGVFGPVRLVPAEGPETGNADVRIARTAERRYRADRELGLDHRIMVRTGSRTRAKELLQLYEEHTGLRLRVVTSDHSYPYAKKALSDIRNDDLDGIVCVDMFGEGFNFPQMKVAALHEPHKSLAVTLQFIGRFARVQAETGAASIVAVPHELDHGVSKLFQEDATWPKLLMDFAATAIGQEQRVRDAIATFHEPDAAPQLENLSLYGLRPFCHSKIYRGLTDVNMTAELTLPKPFEVVFRQASAELEMCVIIGRKLERPKWTDSDALVSSQYEVFACYFDRGAGLLFICASVRTDALYEHLAEQLGDGAHTILSASRISRVLRDLESPRFFHVGMKNSTASSSLESYVTKSGPRAHEAVSPQEGKLYHRGHIMAKGRRGDADVTIGYSSSSRVWSMQYPQLTEWRDWCKALAAAIMSDRPVVTGTNLDILQPGEEVSAFPGDVLSVEWPEEAFRRAVLFKYQASEVSHPRESLLQDVGISVDFDRTPPRQIPGRASFLVSHEDVVLRISFSPGEAPMLTLDSEAPFMLAVDVNGEQVDLMEYLNNHPPSVWLSDCSRLEGQNFFRRNPEREPVDRQAFTAIDWAQCGVCMTTEYADQRNPQPNDGTIHGYVLRMLQEEGASVVVYDHGSYEAADFVGFWDREDQTLVRFYHCKAAAANTAGCRLEEIYEVAGQATKCIRWIHKPAELVEHFHRRSNGQPFRFPVGRLRDVQNLLQSNPKKVVYEVAIVQPGLSIAQLSEPAADVLAAANEYLWRDLGGQHLKVFASA